MTVDIQAPQPLSAGGCPDPGRWPDLATVPGGPRAAIAAPVAARLVRRACRRLGVNLVEGAGAAASAAPTLELHRPEEFYARLGRDGLIGFGEAWQTGAWDSPDPGLLLTTLCHEIDTLVPGWMQRLRHAWVARPPSGQRNEVRNTRANISAHYDLSNEMFALFLDPSLSYSSALFSDGRYDEELLSAQHRKIDRILDRAGVGPGVRVLEIGTGWGELALRAAARGAEVVSVTLSAEQRELAQQRVARAGLSERVRIDLADYREVEGSFDAVVSVEMVEAVGHEYWATYFATIDRLLAPGGRAVVQAITMPHPRMLATRRTWTWINKYIFPGGFLPSVEAIDAVTREATTLRIVDDLAFGADYAETLRRWESTFLARSDEVLALGFDQTFLRTWQFYLAYSRAGFASRYLDVHQLTFAREEQP
ncbi:class I SAM-dependent methyltransferase [Nocardioides daejeonensis]|uniref:class I SAM-dependent methyltransferase n=1 Tax=Nocardioides daejeonensis TaxID=1046556 RepID=UPI001EF3E61E|nr:class I SAM-dependent methyltransferase [Nocardioides daejeonensis]